MKQYRIIGARKVIPNVTAVPSGGVLGAMYEFNAITGLTPDATVGADKFALSPTALGADGGITFQNTRGKTFVFVTNVNAASELALAKVISTAEVTEGASGALTVQDPEIECPAVDLTGPPIVTHTVLGPFTANFETSGRVAIDFYADPEEETPTLAAADIIVFVARIP